MTMERVMDECITKKPKPLFVKNKFQFEINEWIYQI